ncbi:MAG: MerR family transcriptional regulator [Gammaproteobacteria bacterium]|nr:MerR family transcriptional regulator [Gammaproteobacteria bacterium]
MSPRKTSPVPPRRDLTIGALAKRARVAPSVLRYYEKEGLLSPGLRTAAGYRLYGPEAERTLLFINRAKRLGFSLDDIRQFLSAGQPAPAQKKAARGKARPAGSVTRIAEDRFLEIERRLTELLVLRHELEVFLREMSGQLPAEDGARELYRRLVDQVCGHKSTPRTEAASLRSLMKRMGCALASWDRGEVLDILRGRHIHVWRETDGYSVLVPGDDPQIGVALQQIAASEAGCAAHTEPRVEYTAEGYVFSAHGDNAFLFAQFFLALEHRAST